MKLYDFDGVGLDFQLLPLAARRALDHAGRKLSLVGFLSLSVAERAELAELGSAAETNVERVRELCAAAIPPAREIPPISDPSPASVPEAVLSALGPEFPLPLAAWSALDPLDRFALSRAALGKHEERRAQAYREIIGHSALSSHLAPAGGARMVNVGRKEPSLRHAEARSQVTMNAEAFSRLERADVPKGDVLGTARLAGIMAAKRTSDIVPLCHPLALTRIELTFGVGEEAPNRVCITAVVEAFDRTGVEMEALTAASVAALTVYDMLKGFDRGMSIGPTELRSKSGGRSGDYQR